MRIIRFRDTNGAVHWGDSQDGSRVRLLRSGLFDSPLKLSDTTADVAEILAPLDPVNIYCIGKNYLAHAKETGSEAPKRPVVFMKPTTAAQHPGQPILIPSVAVQPPQMDFEGELAVIIGRPARNVSKDRALDYVLAYTCANDVSARWWQKNAGADQWIRGKGFDTFCPLGPAMVTADKIPDPQHGLTITTRVNGREMQNDTTTNMIFSVAAIISYLSQGTTLLPGTVILTGTPAGVGFARVPPVYLEPGDMVEVSINGIGKLTNPVTIAPIP